MAKAVSVAELWRFRGGQSQNLSVSLGKALHRLCPFYDKKWELLNGYAPGNPADPRNPFMPTNSKPVPAPRSACGRYTSPEPFKAMRASSSMETANIAAPTAHNGRGRKRAETKSWRGEAIASANSQTKPKTAKCGTAAQVREAPGLSGPMIAVVDASSPCPSSVRFC